MIESVITTWPNPLERTATLVVAVTQSKRPPNRLKQERDP